MALTAADCAGLQRFLLAAGNGRRVPHSFAVIEPQREHAATLTRIRIGRCGVIQHDSLDIGDGNIDIGLIRGRAPLHPAHRAAFADAHLPEHFALLIGIERMHHPGLLAGEQRPLCRSSA